MLSMTEYVRERVLTYKKREIGIDFTMGNGEDTVFLASIMDEVYSFDIQEDAIKMTQSKINTSHVHLIKDSHSHFDQYVNHYEIGIFNLGYLPGGNHHITTMLESTKIAVQKAIKHMTQVLFIVVYIGHEEGKKESEWIYQYVSTLDKQYNVSTYMMLNKKNAPYVIEIEKRYS